MLYSGKIEGRAPARKSSEGLGFKARSVDGYVARRLLKRAKPKQRRRTVATPSEGVDLDIYLSIYTYVCVYIYIYVSIYLCARG